MWVAITRFPIQPPTRGSRGENRTPIDWLTASRNALIPHGNSTDTGNRTPDSRLRTLWFPSNLCRLAYCGRASNPQHVQFERLATLSISSTAAWRKVGESNTMACTTITFPTCAHHRQGWLSKYRTARCSPSSESPKNPIAELHVEHNNPRTTPVSWQ